MRDGTVIYFAYGSNMLVCRLRERVSSAKALGMGWLPGHRLMFHKKSKKNGSGKCDIVSSEGCTVYGVLFEIDANQETTLDKYEGHGYHKKKVRVQVSDERCMSAFTYYADNASVEVALKPYTWYLKHVITGAEEASLPETYIEEIRTTESKKDPNDAREQDELNLCQEQGASPWRQPEAALEDPRLVDCDATRN